MKNKEMIGRGNHKSALKYTEELELSLKEEIKQGWIIPLPLSYISQLRHGELAPIGMGNKQWKELPDGSKKPKLQMTHDQSFNVSVGRSVNDRIIHEQLDPLYSGGCLSRIIHYILSVRLRHPNIPILGGKSDIKAAYHRITLHGDTAEKCTIMFQDYGLTSTRLTFGGTPCPNQFCLASELCTDLANDLLQCKEWDPKILASPHAGKVGKTSYLDSDLLFAQAKNLDVILPLNDWGYVDDFIDDSIAIVPDIGDNSERAIQALLLAVHILFCPVDPNKPIMQEDCLSLGKLREEGFYQKLL